MPSGISCPCTIWYRTLNAQTTIRWCYWPLFLLVLFLGAAVSCALGQMATAPQAPQVVVSGTVPDEAARSAIVNRVKELYSNRIVLDQLAVGVVVAPPNWSAHVHHMLTPALKQVSRGQLSISGHIVELSGEVATDAIREQLGADLGKSLAQNFSVRNSLGVVTAPAQNLLDTTLANRTIEFEPGSAVLLPQGKQILDEMAVAMAQLGRKPVQLIGHTDALGARASNITLSKLRAHAVRSYLVSKGIHPQLLATTGMGPDQPLQSNDTAAGRARNRRIEFKLS
jgi:OmpA-OmpF porin, OOP family